MSELNLTSLFHQIHDHEGLDYGVRQGQGGFYISESGTQLDYPEQWLVGGTTASTTSIMPAESRLDNTQTETQRWEKKYRQLMGQIASSQGGRVLQIGFGKGVAADKIKASNVEEHWIIENNNRNFTKVLGWKERQSHNVVPLCGNWRECINSLPANYFDGIMFGNFASTGRTNAHMFEFIGQHAHRLLRRDGVFTYCDLPAWGQMLKTKQYKDVVEMFQSTQLNALRESGFNEGRIKWKVLDSRPPRGCLRYQAPQLIAPEIQK